MSKPKTIYDACAEDTRGTPQNRKLDELREMELGAQFKPEYWIAEYLSDWGTGTTLSSALEQLRNVNGITLPKYKGEIKVTGSSAPFHVGGMGWVTKGLTVRFYV